MTENNQRSIIIPQLQGFTKMFVLFASRESKSFVGLYEIFYSILFPFQVYFKQKLEYPLVKPPEFDFYCICQQRA